MLTFGGGDLPDPPVGILSIRARRQHGAKASSASPSFTVPDTYTTCVAYAYRRPSVGTCRTVDGYTRLRHAGLLRASTVQVSVLGTCTHTMIGFSFFEVSVRWHSRPLPPPSPLPGCRLFYGTLAGDVEGEAAAALVMESVVRS